MCAYELDNLWGARIDVLEVGYNRTAESRGTDIGHKVLQIFADTVEMKRGEIG
jgi:hypothetical protein